MGYFIIKKGKNIKIKGKAKKIILEMPMPLCVAVQPYEFRGLNLRVIAKEGCFVKRGDVLLSDKVNPDITVLSPVSGKVVEVKRGAKRVLREIIVEIDKNQRGKLFSKYQDQDIVKLSREETISVILKGGMWTSIQKRPFSKVADPKEKPKSIFVKAMNTDPLAIDTDFVLEGKEKEFQSGVNALRNLTEGDVHICFSGEAKSKTLTEVKNVNKHTFEGPHPAGNVSTHIYNIDKIEKNEIIWYIEAQDVVRIGQLLLTGEYPNEKIIAIGGEGVKDRLYAKTIIGAPLKSLTGESDIEGMQCISGSILSGDPIEEDGFVCQKDTQVTVIPKGGGRKFLGWILPGKDSFTLSGAYVSSLFPKEEYSIGTDKNGGERAIVYNHVYDEYTPLDIPVFFLLRAILANDIEEAERLGILEVDPEDFALCSVVCPSKVDIGHIIQKGLSFIEKEG